MRKRGLENNTAEKRGDGRFLRTGFVNVPPEPAFVFFGKAGVRRIRKFLFIPVAIAV